MAGRPVDGILAAIAIAREFNHLFGGAFVAPWEIEDLPEEYHLARVALRADLSKWATANQAIEARKAEIRARHYRRG